MFQIGDRFLARGRRLESPTLADKLAVRGVLREEVAMVLRRNRIVEIYADEGRLRYVLWGEAGDRLLHVVVAEDDILDATVVISAYEPDERFGWDAASRYTRRKEGRA